MYIPRSSILSVHYMDIVQFSKRIHEKNTSKQVKNYSMLWQKNKIESNKKEIFGGEDYLEKPSCIRGRIILCFCYRGTILL